MKTANNYGDRSTLAVFIYSQVPMVGCLLLILMLSIFPLFAQTKPETKTEDYNGGKKTTTYRDTEDGDHIVETEIRDAKGLVTEKSVETTNASGRTLDVEGFKYDAKGNLVRKSRTVFRNGEHVLMQREYYKDGVIIDGYIRGESGDPQEYRLFNSQTGIYEVVDPENFDRKFVRFADRELDLKKGSSAEPKNDGTYKTSTLFYRGINDYKFTTPFGSIETNIPNLLAPNEPSTGTLNIDPDGKTKEEKAKNETELKKFQIQLPDGTKIEIQTDKPFQFTTPPPQSDGSGLFLLKDNKPVSFLPVDLMESLPTERSTVLPSGGQQGRYLVLTGPFSGRIGPNDSVRIGDKPMQIIGETPRQRIILNDSETIGLSKIVSTESGRVSECAFRNIGLKMSADSLHLLRGQTTTLHVQVLGLEKITNELPLTIVNDSTTVISLSGGNSQLVKINPTMVGSDGIYSLNQTLTGIVPGSFGVTGTVEWTANCSNNDDTGTATQEKPKDEKKVDSKPKDKYENAFAEAWFGYINAEDIDHAVLNLGDQQTVADASNWWEALKKSEDQKLKKDKAVKANQKAQTDRTNAKNALDKAKSDQATADQREKVAENSLKQKEDFQKTTNEKLNGATDKTAIDLRQQAADDLKKAQEDLTKAKNDLEQANQNAAKAEQAFKDADKAATNAQTNLKDEQAKTKAADQELKDAEKSVPQGIRDSLQKIGESNMEKAQQEKVLEKKPD